MAVVLGGDGKPLKFGDAIDLDEPISADSPLDDSVELLSTPVVSAPVVSLDEDEFPSELSLAQPTIDEIENAWDSTEAWDSQEPASTAIDGDDDIDTSLGIATTDSQPIADRTSDLPRDRQKTSRSNDDRSHHHKHLWGRKPRKVARLLKIASPTLLALPIIGGLLLYFGTNLGFYPFNGSSNLVVADASQSLSNRDEAITESDGDGDNPPATPKSVGRVLVDSDQDADNDSSYITVEEMIQSLDGRAKEFADDSPTETDNPPAVTIEMIAMRQRESRDDGQKMATPEDATENLNESLLVFPAQPPSVDLIRQVQAEVVSETDSDSAEIIAACNRAIESVKQLGPNKRGDVPNKVALKSKLLAFRDISRVGSLTVDANSPSVSGLLSELTHTDALTQLMPLCSEWVGWGGRKTDGMLLIGKLQDQDGETYVQLNEAMRVDVELAPDRRVLIGSQCAMLCKIISDNDSPRVQLVAGMAVH